MKIHDLRVAGIRCFEDTGDFLFDPKCNIFVGKNNAGKSTILKAIVGLQSYPFDGVDIRPGHQNSSFVTIRFKDISPSDYMSIGRNVSLESLRTSFAYSGNHPEYNDATLFNLNPGHPVFALARPHHMIVPFLEPIQEESIHEQGLGLVKRLSMRRIIARRTNAATVVA